MNSKTKGGRGRRSRTKWSFGFASLCIGLALAGTFLQANAIGTGSGAPDQFEVQGGPGPRTEVYTPVSSLTGIGEDTSGDQVTLSDTPPPPTPMASRIGAANTGPYGVKPGKKIKVTVETNGDVSPVTDGDYKVGFRLYRVVHGTPESKSLWPADPRSDGAVIRPLTKEKTRHPLNGSTALYATTDGKPLNSAETNKLPTGVYKLGAYRTRGVNGTGIGVERGETFNVQ